MLASAGGLCGVGSSAPGGTWLSVWFPPTGQSTTPLWCGARPSVLALLGVAFAVATARRASPPPPPGALIESVHTTGRAGDVVGGGRGSARGRLSSRCRRQSPATW